MGRIQTNVGLLTGFPIQDTVDQLMAVSARPRDMLTSRNESLKQQQVALTELSSLVLGVQIALAGLETADVFHEKTASSQDDQLLSASVTGDPAPGIYPLTPARQAQTHHLVSSGVESLDQPIGQATLSIGFGGLVDDAILLDDLNQGQGIQRGTIRITDRSGASAVIDLRFATTIDDVLDAINTSDAIQVTAQADGDRIQLVDNTGQATTNLRVQQFGVGTTAADLGLDGVDVAASQATGSDLLSLHAGTRLSRLNDGTGVALRSEQADLEVTFRDGSAPLQIDLDPGNVSTLGDLLDALNSADPARLRAELSPDADHLVLTDLTAGAGSFSISSTEGGQAAEDLGLTGAAVGGQVTSRRLMAGLRTTLIDSLGGGSGLQLGLIHLQDRTGSVATVDLASAETLEEVINAINNGGNGLTARVNDARNGILVTDTTAGAGNLTIANLGGTQTADALGIAIDQATSAVDGGSLDRQVVSHQTRLDSLYGGRGISNGSFTITDSQGEKGAINLTVSATETVGDIVDEINRMGIGVTARINDRGDGILLIDTAGGNGTLHVADAGSSTAAADLRIAGSAVTVDVGGVPTSVIDGATTATVDIDADDTLVDLVEKINALDAGVGASVLNVGGGSAPYRLSLVSETSGRSGRLLVDAGETGLDMQEISAGQDALLLLGSADSAGAGILLSSPTNTFDNVLDGLELSVNGTSKDPVSIEVDTTTAKVVEAIHAVVDKFNSLRDRLDELTFFNEADNTTGILFGTNEALRIETGFTDLLTSRFPGVGSVGWLEQLGISLTADGHLDFDEESLQSVVAEDPQSVEQLFTDEDLGVVAKLTALVDRLAGEQSSLLTTRTDALQRTIDHNADRIERMSERLDRQRERLTRQFIAMEDAVAKMQSDLAAISSIAALPPLTVNSTNGK